MAGKNRVNIEVGFSVDKSGLSEMQSYFQQIANKAKEPGNEFNASLQKAGSTAATLNRILEQTFNTDLGSLNVTKFNQELSKSGLTLKSIKSDLSSAGNLGATAYNRMTQAILGTNLQLKESNKLLDQMAVTMANTVRWGITSSIFKSITSSISNAYTYVKRLDTSLNDIRIVTDKSAESMDKFAEKANQAAKGLGASTLDYTNASLIYYQQGLDDAEVQARAETTLKAANVTGQSGQEVSEQLTAVWNGYKVTAEETELYVDKLAAVAATTAADLEELSTGMSKVAAAANAMGVDFDDLNAQIATIVSVTRQAPESVGTALKTIYARLGDLKVDGVDEFGVKLGEVSSQLETMGIQILDQDGNLRDMSSVIAEVAQKWNTWTEAQQQAAAIAMAGKRQYNNLIALFENWDMYTDALETSTEAMGTLQHQQDIYMESTSAKLKTLKATWQDLYEGLLDNDELNAGIDGLTNLVQVFDNFIDSFGGGIKAITAFGAVVSNIFNKQISEAINNAIQRQNQYKENVQLLELKQQAIQNGTFETTGDKTRDAAIEYSTEKELQIAKQIYDVRVGLSSEEYNSLTNMQQKVGALVEEQKYEELSLVRTNKKIFGKEKELETEEKIKKLLDLELSEIEEIGAEHASNLDTEKEQLEVEQEKYEAFKNQLQRAIDHQASGEKRNIGFYKQHITEKAAAIDPKVEKAVSKILDKEVNSYKDLRRLQTELNSNAKIKVEAQEETIKGIEKEIELDNKVYQSKKKITEAEEKKNNLQQQINTGLEKGAQGVGVAQTVTTITSSLSTMAMAWSSVNSLIQTFNDESASFGDKVTQTFMTLGMTVPMVISSFDKLKETFGKTTNVLNTFSALSQKHNALLNVVTSNTGKLTIANQVNAMSQDVLTVLKEKDNLTEEEGILIDKLSNSTTKEKILLLGALDKEKLIEIGLTKQEAAAIMEAKLAQDELNASMLMSPYTWVLAGIVALIAVISGVTKHLDEWHKKEKEKAETDLEEIKNNENKVKENKELVDSYDALIARYNNLKESQLDTTEVSKELYDKTLELAKAYDIQGASLLALGEHYDILLNKVNSKRTDELTKNVQDAYKGAEDATKIIAHSMSEGMGNSGHIRTNKSGKQTYFNQVSTYGSDQREMLLQAAKSAGLDNQLEENLDANGDLAYTYKIDFEIDDPEGAKQQLDNINKLIEGYQLNYSEAVLKTDAIYQEFLKEQEQFSEKYQELIDQLNVAYESRVSLAILNSDIESSKNAQELYEKIKNIKDTLSDIDPDTLDKLISNALSGMEDLQDEVNKIDLAESIEEKTGELAEDVLKIINNFNDKQLSLLQVHLDTATLSGDIEDWVKKNEIVLTQAQLITTGNSISTALENYDAKKGGFQPENISSIFSQGNAEDVVGMSSEQFASLDYGDQIQTLTEAWINNTKEVVKNKDTIIDSYETQLKEWEDLLEAHDELDKRDTETFDNLIRNNDELVQKRDVLKQALINLAEDGYDKLSFEDKKLIKDFEDLDGVTEGVAKRLGETFKTTEDYETAIQDLNSLITEAANTTEDYTYILQKLNDVKAAQNAIMDDIQSAFKSLISIVDDYNETGAWTIDNVQQLITMDDRYVASLQFENGQLSLNEQAFQAMTLAKLDDLEASVDLEYQQTMTAIAHKSEALAAQAAAAASLAAAADFETMGNAALSAAEGVAILKDTLRQIGPGSDDYKALAEQTEKAWENRKKAIEDARNNVKKGGKSMRAAMGAPSKADKGGGKDKKEKELKEFEDEFDRYWELKKAIDATDRSLKRLEKDKENYYGYQLIDALKKENALLETQRENYERLAEAQRQEAAELREQLGTMGVMFDASGAITNYAAATAQALAAYNAAIQQYNAGLIDETTLGVYEKAYENFKKLLDRYDKLYYTELKETEDKLDEIRRKEIANNLKAWEVELDVKLNFKELKRGWNDFIKEINEDFKKVYKNLKVEVDNLKKNAKTFIGSDGTLTAQMEAIRQVMAEIDKMRAGGKSNMFESISQAQEKLKELNDMLQDSARALHDLWKQAWEALLDGIDQVADKFEDLMDRFEKINDELEFQKELVELLYGEEAYGLMDSFYKGQEKSLENQLQSVKQQVDMWKQQFEQSGASMENQEEWTEEQKKLYEQWMEAQGKLNDLTLEYIKMLKEDYANTISKIMKELEQGLTGSSLKDMRTEWERISAYSDKYLDDVEQAYEAQKFANKIDQDIANSNNLKAQQKLQAFRDKEIKYLREKKNLTQYDLDAAEAKYQITLKEIALEEAQNNKTSMKLVRNEQGNWSYQYTADEEDVASKQQDLLDAYGNLYELASNAYESNLEELQELQEKYLESAKEIALDDTLTEEQKQQKLLELRTWYEEQYKLLAEENKLYRDDLQASSAALLLEIYRQDEEAYTSMTEAERALLDDLLTASVDGYLDLEEKVKDNYKNIGEASKELMKDTRQDWTSTAQQLADLWNKDDGKSVKAQLQKAYDAIKKATEEYKAKVDWCAEAVGRDFGEEGIKGAIDKAADSTDQLKDKTEQLVNDGVSYLASLRAAVEEIEAAWKAVQAQIQETIRQLEEYLKLRAEANNYGGQNGNTGGGGSGGDGSGGGNSGGGGNGSGGGGTPGNGKDGYQYRIVYVSEPRYRGSTDTFAIDVRSSSGQTRTIDLGKNPDPNYNSQYKRYLEYPGVNWNTGGYTGEWQNGDKDGRLGFLHQKELILNKDDTANFLEGVKLIRDMTGLNGSISNAITSAVSNMITSLASVRPGVMNNVSTTSVPNNENNTFNITAEFPNANNVDDIREALLTLPNLASQFVARNNR